MRLLCGLVLLLVLALAGCGTDTDADTDAGGGPYSRTDTDAGTDAGSDAPGEKRAAELDFTATTLEGEAFDGASLAGTPTVLWFWAPWCPTCRAQIPTVSGLAEEYAGRVEVVGVGGLDTQGEIEDLARDIEHVTHLVDDEGVVWQHFGVTAQSTYTVLDAEGRLVKEGYLDNGALEDLVADLAS